MARGRRLAALGKRSGQSFDYNGRVVVDLHGNPGRGILEFEYAGVNLRYEPFELGSKLGSYFLEENLNVKRLDFVVCFGGTVIPKVVEGLKAVGVNDLHVLSFAADEVRTSVPDHPVHFKDSLTIVKRTPGSHPGSSDTVHEYEIGLDDFYVRGQLPKDLPENLILQYKIGDPETVLPPAYTDEPTPGAVNP